MGSDVYLGCLNRWQTLAHDLRPKWIERVSVVQALCFGNPELYIQRKFLDRSESTTKQASNIELLPPGRPCHYRNEGLSR